MASTATAGPTTEIGAPVQSTPFGVPILTDREQTRDLTWPRSVKTYASMLNDAQLEGLYRGATLPIRSYDWRLDPNGARPEIVEGVRADLGLDLVGQDPQPRPRTQRRFVLDGHLEDALRGIGYGHYFFEQVGEIVGQLWRLRKLAPRPPATITQIQPARDGGLDFIKVPSLEPDKRTGGLAQITGVELPVDRLVAYVWDREGANWHGRSMLRSCYRPWKLKDRVLRIGAINIERAGGVPYVEAPDGATPRMMAELHSLASKFRVGESAGAALPHGATLKFAQAAGGDAAINYIRLQNEEMARAWLMMFMQLGQTQTGSRAMAETFVDYLRLAQHAIANWFVDVFNEHVIEDWVDWNYGAEETYAPLLTYTDHTADPTNDLVNAVGEASEEGALPNDSQVAAALGVRTGRTRPKRVAAATPTPAEQSQTDFATLQAQYEGALTQLTHTWDGVRAVQITDLVGQVEAATTITTLASVTPAVAGAAALLEVLDEVLEHGAQTAVDEAAAQGATLDMPDLTDAKATVTGAADAVATLLARDLGESAASKAVALAGGGLDYTEVAAEVRSHLEGLAGATPAYEIAGLVSRAQNEGRFTAMEGAAAGTDFYASDVNDTNTCDPCRAEDGTHFPVLAEARRDFPAGKFLGCLGGNRCRCTIVAIYAETPGQAA